MIDAGADDGCLLQRRHCKERREGEPTVEEADSQVTLRPPERKPAQWASKDTNSAIWTTWGVSRGVERRTKRLKGSEARGPLWVVGEVIPALIKDFLPMLR